jgi:outer membrane biosynthesis protein TonB
MRALHYRIAVLALFAAAFSSGCHRKKPPQPVMVPPAVEVPVPEKQPAQPPPPPPLPPSQTGTAIAPPPAATEQNVPGPPRKHRRQTKKTQTAQSSEAQPPAATAPAPATTATTTPAPVPQLGQMLTDQQRRDYEARIQAALDRARANLQKARSNPNLTDAQKNMAAQVASFVDQAEERRKTDLVSARSLAERADLLARDLAEGK